jgi:hypothetical protein
MSSETSVDRFSTVAEFELLIADRSYRVAQVAPDFLILENAAEIAPSPGVVVIRVDKQEMRREILLPLGTETGSLRVQISRP